MYHVLAAREPGDFPRRAGASLRGLRPSWRGRRGAGSAAVAGRILVNGQNQQADVWLGEQMTLVPRQQVTVKASASDAPESRDETSNGPQQGLQPHLDQG
ncbi:unnamed protein product [Rangifer tarandus platyrhynchus]|uniref:Uncharacterized protein n=1 Tax=Rangifer tarandus platyrhynchus TaxID=3082113 RepID=A0AC59ZZ62_RANTA